jgi:TolB protein
MTIRVGLLCLVTVVLALVPAFARATTPGSNGKIAFFRYRLQDNPLWSEIYVANPDGTGERRVSRSAIAVEDENPRWSPDGKLIVFSRCTQIVCSIWLVNPDGTQQRRLTPVCKAAGPPPACSDNSHPSFAPDGRHVVYVRATGRIEHESIGDQIQNSEVVMTDLTGRHLTVLLRLGGFRGDFGQPQLSPNGTQLVFRRYNSVRAYPKNGRALFVVNRDGSGLRRITPWSLRATRPDWAPDGSRILFASNAVTGNLEPGTNLYTVRPDGTDLQQLTHLPTTHYVLAGSYSPDGKAIVYATDLGATPKPNGNAFPDIVTQPLAGGPVTRITRTANLDGWPAWGSSLH